MKDEALRVAAIEAGLKMLPPSVCASLLDDENFLKRSGLAVTSSVKLGDDGPSFERILLFDAFRTAVDHPSAAIPVVDASNEEWMIVARLEADEWQFSVEGNGRVFAVADHSVLSADPAIRLAWVRKQAAVAGLPRESAAEWERFLEQRAPDATDFDRLHDDLDANPRAQQRALKGAFGHRVKITQLVPQNRKYYERLVGEAQPTLGSYLATSIPSVLERIYEEGSSDGRSAALGIAMSSLISRRIDLQLATPEAQAALECIATSGDPIRTIAALEVGLRAHTDNPELAPVLQKLAKRLLDFDPNKRGDPVALLSAIFVLVAGELARTKILSGAPPYWVRQCALSHATLLVRVLLESTIDIGSFTEWVNSQGYGHLFFLQGLVDLRLEPRWLPDFADANQLLAELVGRALLAAHSLEEEIPAGQLRDLLVNEGGELRSRVKFPFPFLPGPLEGSSALAPLPDVALSEVRKALTTEAIEAGSFVGLVNSALVYEIPADLGELAAQALRRVKHNLDHPRSPNAAFNMLSGLAIVAAATRGVALAEEVRILARIMRRRGEQYSIANGEFRIALVAAASHSSLDEWARCAGEWLTELAFDVEDKSDAAALLSDIRRLVDIEPALAAKVATADAALSSLL